MTVRVIAKLDVKPPFVVKPVHYDGLRKIGSPSDIALSCYTQGADEIFYIDIVASLYRRGILYKDIKRAAGDVFVPLAVGGGVRSVQDFSDLFHAGADKVIINTYAVQEDPGIIDAAAAVFGSQAVVVSIEAKRWDGWWECYTDSGRIRSGREVFGWMQEAEKRGCGEFLVNCVDTDGRRRGFDIALAEGAVEAVGVPVVIGSGAGTLEHIATVVRAAGPAGIAVASMLHYGMASIADIKNTIKDL